MLSRGVAQVRAGDAATLLRGAAQSFHQDLGPCESFQHGGCQGLDATVVGEPAGFGDHGNSQPLLGRKDLADDDPLGVRAQRGDEAAGGIVGQRSDRHGGARFAQGGDTGTEGDG